MTYDEWKKARVEAATHGIDENYSRIYESDAQMMGCLADAALERADAVPLPNEEELVKELAAICHNNYWADEYANASEVEKAGARQQGKAVVAALRPWIASMIEKGKGV